ncbi:2-succinyl-5-enolpyruvyl-6-hydroxy-3-cyclohexene-1-carboxylic-acid synthase [Dictyobacter arantiisoli]|uniref:2-succinyl-5-enolpyruvyl-6-hydroxy-3-cyclohexene-1-carboxylate synthase n=1 Tax=Dictyobacter arantiisoli TaxID=2014874 RepID=A0A5A5TC14_9CHLR|nr:2-succinyl-5-enolpyruvyl-6-hydroxy-3-cyclohexene-1-carboxylic-acid synthase [Dictyobacter arantiisoli]GCF08563.1 2-succinyl-5-enolpyruvyl-6-hydroxy-3-cyclohexene- 1-carboxylate synthase [Dictyobacter arantiisoli]
MAQANMDAYELHAENPTYVYINAFIDELQRSNVHNIVICPGSRSTPLALAIAAHPGLKAWMHVDERSAAFFALGMARRLERPVAVVCTSGSAAANFFPAIVEARLTHVPLLILTADRPHELRENGAPQAIDQLRLYGTHVKWFAEVALPEASNAALRYIRTLADRVAALASAVPAGPVHLNFPFREPLTPGPLADQPLPAEEQRDPIAWHGRPHHQPYIAVEDAPLGRLTSAACAQIIEQLKDVTHGLIIAGPYHDAALTAPLLQLAQTLGYPILADPLSQLRSGPHDHSLIVTGYDAFLRMDSFIGQHEPQVVLRFGAMPTAKPLLLYVKRYADCPQIVVDADGGWNEPTQLATQMVHADPALFCQDVEQGLRQLGQGHAVARDAVARDQAWLQLWLRTDRVTREALLTALRDFPDLFEGRVFTELSTLLPEGATLFAGNSMPVRDMDTFFWGDERAVRIVGNRGANGIDGIVSSALGTSAGSRSQDGEQEQEQGKTPTVLVIGDLSFFHDLNGLLAARLHQLDLVIVLINNDGGGIFSFLPQAAYPEHFEQVFGTPTGLDFQPVVQMYGGAYRQVADWNDFRQAFQQGVQSGGLHVIEVRTERVSNVAMHRQLWQVVERALRDQEEQ